MHAGDLVEALEPFTLHEQSAVAEAGCCGALATVRAPAAGVPLFITTSPAVAAGGLLLGLAAGEST